MLGGMKLYCRGMSGGMELYCRGMSGGYNYKVEVCQGKWIVKVKRMELEVFQDKIIL
jgi:hypothetical protein